MLTGLKGVRKGLSISLSFRPHHSADSWQQNLRFHWHKILVLLDFRRSLSSLLRQHLLKNEELPALSETVAGIESLPSTAAYLILSNGSETVNIEKDNCLANKQSSNEFIIVHNHDELDEEDPERLKKAVASDPSQDATGMADIISNSVDRKNCALALWKRATRSQKRGEAAVKQQTVVGWMEGDEIVNEETHYAVVMKPQAGSIIWARRWLTPKTGQPSETNIDVTYMD